MIVYRCEDSLESIFTAIYLAYENRDKLSEVYLALSDERLLFAKDREVLPDPDKVLKVMNTCKRRFGEKDYMTLCLALASEDEEKAQAVFQTIARGLSTKCSPGHLFDSLAEDAVLKAFHLARGAERELQHMKGFLRFQELENGILYAKIGTKNNLLTFLMPHFADRFQIENFVIYDAIRNFFGIHPKNRQWFLCSGENAEGSDLQYSLNEPVYQQLFRHFCKTIAIKERENPELQRNMLPLRFRDYMVEFDKNGRNCI